MAAAAAKEQPAAETRECLKYPISNLTATEAPVSFFCLLRIPHNSQPSMKRGDRPGKQSAAGIMLGGG